MSESKKTRSPKGSGSEAVAAEKGSAVKAAADTVFVALNHPHGVQFALPNGRRVTIQGNASNLRRQVKGILPRGSFGLTEVARSDWEEIQKRYGGHMQLFKSGLIFAHDKRDMALDEAAEKAELRHGREPVAVEGPERNASTEPAATAGQV